MVEIIVKISENERKSNEIQCCNWMDEKYFFRHNIRMGQLIL